MLGIEVEHRDAGCLAGRDTNKLARIASPQARNAAGSVVAALNPPGQAGALLARQGKTGTACPARARAASSALIAAP